MCSANVAQCCVQYVYDTVCMRMHAHFGMQGHAEVTQPLPHHLTHQKKLKAKSNSCQMKEQANIPSTRNESVTNDNANLSTKLQAQAPSHYHNSRNNDI